MKLTLRVKKSRSIMWSLYSLSGMAGLAYLTLVILVLLFFYNHLEMESLGVVFQLFVHSFGFVLVATLLSLPVAMALCLLIITKPSSGFSLKLQKILKIIDQSPILISGVFYMVILGGGLKSLYLAGSFLAVSKLVNRWVKLSESISDLQIDTAKSLGMNAWQMLNILYLKRFYMMYIGHFFSVICFLFSVVTPFLCIVNDFDTSHQLFSVYFFNLLGSGSGLLSSMAMILLVIHCTRLWLDSKAFYSETEHG